MNKRKAAVALALAGTLLASGCATAPTAPETAQEAMAPVQKGPSVESGPMPNGMGTYVEAIGGASGEKAVGVVLAEGQELLVMGRVKSGSFTLTYQTYEGIELGTEELTDPASLSLSDLGQGNLLVMARCTEAEGDVCLAAVEKGSVDVTEEEPSEFIADVLAGRRTLA